MRRWASRRNQWRSGLSNGPLEPWIKIKDRIYISHSRARGKDEGRGDSRQMTIAKKIALITGGKIHKEERETPLSSLGRRQRARHRRCTQRDSFRLCQRGILVARRPIRAPASFWR